MNHTEIESDINVLCKELQRKENYNAKLLGLDLGKKKLGLAIYYAQMDLILPYKVLKRGKDRSEIAKIIAVIEELGICNIVIGLPLQDGVLLDSARYIPAFAARMLAENARLKIYFEDESFSTSAAIEMLQGVGLKRRKRDEVDDAVAAAVILQSFVDRISVVSSHYREEQLLF